MAITPTGANAALSSSTNAQVKNDKGTLGKDDFMKLLLVELKYQDPTAPTDTEKILSQTSQLATLESADNTNSALEKLTKSLGSSQQFSTIAAIGKTADLGSDSISHDKDSESTFEIYFPSSVKAGSIEISDGDGNVVKTINVEDKESGVYQFTWNGIDNTDTAAKSGIYHISSTYTDKDGNAQSTKLGAYPITSVKFDDGDTYLKLGSNYVPLANVKEVY